MRIFAGEAEAESARTVDSGRDYLQVKKRLHEQTVAPSRATIRAVEWRPRLARADRIENAEGSISAAGSRAPVCRRRIVSREGGEAQRVEIACRKARRSARR